MYTYLCSFKTSPYLANSVPLLRFVTILNNLEYSKMSKCKGWSIPQKSLVASSSLIRVTLSSCEVFSILNNKECYNDPFHNEWNFKLILFFLVSHHSSSSRAAHLHFFSSSRVFLSNLFIAPFTHSRHLCARGEKIAVVQKRV